MSKPTTPMLRSKIVSVSRLNVQSLTLVVCYQCYYQLVVLQNNIWQIVGKKIHLTSTDFSIRLNDSFFVPRCIVNSPVHYGK